MSLEPEDPVKEVGMFYCLSCLIIKKLVPLAGLVEKKDELNSFWHNLFFPIEMTCPTKLHMNWKIKVLR